MARNGVDWNHVYGSWRKEDWRIDVSLMFETLPIDKWKDLKNDSRSYAERFARAFGPSGTNKLVESVEIGNEPGKFSDTAYRTLFENMARGLRAGDSNLLISTCALTTSKSHDYAKSVTCISGLEDLYDVLNVHTYAQLKGWPTWERSYPEDPRLKDYLADIKNLADWRDHHAPGKKLWITEFGYDATTKTPNLLNRNLKTGSASQKNTRRNGLSAHGSFFSTLPVDRAYLYFFNDDDSPQLHGSSGLTRNFQPKPAFYAAAHLYKTLADYRFQKVILDRPGEVMLYEFADGKNSRIWAAWSPTGNGNHRQIDLPPIKGTIQKIETMPLTAAAPGPSPINPKPSPSPNPQLTSSFPTNNDL